MLEDGTANTFDTCTDQESSTGLDFDCSCNTPSCPDGSGYVPTSPSVTASAAEFCPGDTINLTYEFNFEGADESFGMLSGQSSCSDKENYTHISMKKFMKDLKLNTCKHLLWNWRPDNL